MLGNFGFGDYFKHDAIQYAWELLTGENWFNLPKERLWVTVYETDDEAYTKSGKKSVSRANVLFASVTTKGAPYASDNFWQMGDTGPCGPCTGSSTITATTSGVVLRAALKKTAIATLDLEHRLHAVQPSGRRHHGAAAKTVR